MESSLERSKAFQALKIHLDEGVDEWILTSPVSRFDLAKEVKAVAQKPVEIPQSPLVKNRAENTEENEAQDVDFAKLTSEEMVLEALYAALPQGLQNQIKNPVEALGGKAAEIVVIVDPPFREAADAGNLAMDASICLLRRSLQAIGVDLDASLGREPFAQVRIVPVFPWRMPQDRKFVEKEAVLIVKALAQKVALSPPRAILLAGSNLADIGELIEDGKLWDVPVFELVSPRVMLREPSLKRIHWQRLLVFRQALEALMQP